MTEEKRRFTYKEFLAYLLLFSAWADLEIQNEEKCTICDKVSNEIYDKVKKTFENSNDYQRLQIIISYRDEYYNNDQAAEKIINDVKDIFLADHKFSSTEQAIFNGLKRILK